MIPTPPARARQRLSRTIVRALADPGARDELARLAEDPSAVRAWFGPGPPGVGARLRARAVRAWSLLRDRPLAPWPLPLSQALEWAALLFDGGLGFEVHELLEPYWRDGRGEEREAVQGLIQIAAGYQHLADGRPEAARRLLCAGTSRLAGRRLAGLPLEGFTAAVKASLGRLATEGVEPPPFPRASPDP